MGAPRPENYVPPTDFSSLPDELKKRSQWVCWKWEIRDGKPTKVPCQATGRKANHSNPRTWAGFAEVVLAVETGRFDGIGFVLSSDDDYTFIDLDHHRDAVTGEPDSFGSEILKVFAGAYVEVSPSGTGYHIITCGSWPGTWNKKGKVGVEVYSRQRFATMTAQRVGVAPTWPDHTPQLRVLHDTIAEKVIENALAAKNAAKFFALFFKGDTSEYGQDDSAADLALCNILAFWTEGNAREIDRLFRRSGLMRAKWDERRGERTYGQMTIDTALSGNVGPEPSRDGQEPERQRAEIVHPYTLAQAEATFQRWLHLTDLGELHVTLSTVAANRLARGQGDPTWLLIVGGSGSGKTEIIQATNGLPEVRSTGTLTEAALLSGTPRRQKDASAKGGLLREIGEYGILLAKDFTSVLSMNRDGRAALLAALREIFDGHWTRNVGVDGGRTLDWNGHLGLIAGCTTAIDSAHTVIATMGTRFLYFRNELTEQEEGKQAERALANAAHLIEMRAELRGAVSGFFAGLQLDHPPELTDEERERLVALAHLAARCRSTVEREPYKNEIIRVDDPEAPGRLVQALSRLYGGMLAIGVGRALAWQHIAKVGLDCMPKLRLGLFKVLATRDPDTWSSTRDLAGAVPPAGYPTNTARRALEDLMVHGVVERQAREGNLADLWQLSQWARGQLQAAGVPENCISVPDLLVDMDKGTYKKKEKAEVEVEAKAGSTVFTGIDKSGTHQDDTPEATACVPETLVTNVIPFPRPGSFEDDAPEDNNLGLSATAGGYWEDQ